MSPAQLEALLHAIDGRRVLCVGDLILDRFIYGPAKRVSREAPVVALSERRREAMLGAAGNVARNVAALGGRPIIAAAIGDDPESHEVSRLLGAGDVEDVELVVAKGRATPVKTRYVAGGQQVFCVDRDPQAPLAEEHETAMIAGATGALADADILILSDYGRGAMTPRVTRAVLDAAAKAGVRAIADPRGRDFTRYDGAYLLKPNAEELGLEAGFAVDDDGAAAAALKTVMAQMGDLENLLVTRGGGGMALLRRGGAPEFFRSEPRDVYDVSGAGDTTIAALALALAADASLADAITFANRAGGVVVTKVGTATVRAEEILADARGARSARGRVAGLAEAAEIAARWRADGRTVGLTNGCFDLLHVGHLASLRHAGDRCDRLIVAVNDDASVRRLKGPERPLNTASDRAAVIAAIAGVDLVVVFGEDTAVDVVKAVRPDVYVKGGDYTPDQLPEAAAVEEGGGRVVIAPLTPDRSTTAVIDRMAGSSATTPEPD